MLLHINFLMQLPDSFFLILDFAIGTGTVLNIAIVHGIEFLEPYFFAKFNFFEIVPEFEELLLEFVGAVAYNVLDEIFHDEILPF